MISIFPKFIKELPKASIPINGCTAYLFQGKKQQIVFMNFKKDTFLPEHKHDSQWEIVLEGEVEVYINKIKNRYKKGDSFYIPSQTPHSAKIKEGYSSIVIFNQKDRYNIK